MSDRLPPNQSLVAPGRWPLVGEKAPDVTSETWHVALDGLVARPASWTIEQLQALPRTEIVIDIHCVTRWSRYDVPFAGVRLADLFEAAGGLAAEATSVHFHARSERGHTTSLTLDDANECDVLVALEADGAPLTTDHGGPVRTVTPGRYFYKSIKWLERIEVCAEHRLGWWEAEAGYHDRADPWREERYLAPNLDRNAVLKAMASRDMRGLDLRSVSAAGRELDGLRADEAALRDADFSGASLRGASFTGANCTNASFVGADLREADFGDADVEGADFRGADLRGTDLRVTSLFGASFGPETGGAPESPARYDAATQWAETTFAALTPSQRRWVPGGDAARPE